MRRSARRTEDVEIISAFKSQDAIRRADLVMLMVDGTEGPSQQDLKILDDIMDAHKAVILVANKIDLGEKQIPNFRKWFKERTQDEMHFFPDIPIVFLSAKTGRGIEDLFKKNWSNRRKITNRDSDLATQ